MFKISTNNGKVFEGEIAAIDPITKFIALKQEEGSYIIINPSNVQQIHGDLNKIKLPDISQLGLRFFRNIVLTIITTIKSASKLLKRKKKLL